MAINLDGIVNTVKKHPLPIMLGAGGLVAVSLLARGSSGSPGKVSTLPGGSGSLVNPFPTTPTPTQPTEPINDEPDVPGPPPVTAGDVAGAIADAIGSIRDQVGSQQAANLERSQQLFDLIQERTNNVQKQIVEMQLPQQVSSALSARQKIGDAAIIAWAKQIGVPDWIGLQYIAERKELPQSLPEFEAWLNSHGYRHGTTLTIPATIPAGVMQLFINSFGHYP